MHANHSAAVLILATLAGANVLTQTSAQPPIDGIALKRPVFGGACRICPWGAVGDVVKLAMKPYGYDVQICSTCNNIRYVADKEMGRPIEVAAKDTLDISILQRHPNPSIAPEFGAVSTQNLWSAYQGLAVNTTPRRNLRLLATIQSPNYLMVAVRADTGITDLGQIKQKRWPVRVLAGGGEGTAVLAYYGLTPESIKAAGGYVGGGRGTPEERAIRKDFDVIIHGGSLATAPEFDVWYEVSQRHDLRFLQLPDELIAKLAKETNAEVGAIPNGLLRGIDHAIPTVVRTGHSVYGLADMAEDFAYAVAKALDEQQHLFQYSNLNLSYNLRTVWKAFGVPLHPGAARYYIERGYMKQK